MSRQIIFSNSFQESEAQEHDKEFLKRDLKTLHQSIKNYVD